MSGDADDADTGIDMKARSKEDPDIHWKGLLRSYRPTKPIIAAVEGVAIAGGTGDSASNGYQNRRRKC